MPREKKRALVPGGEFTSTLDVPTYTRRQRLLRVVVALKGAERELDDLRAEVEPKSRNAEALMRESVEQVARARQSLENYQDELEVWQ